ncbi:GNAT family N-acetyltransferase [Heyndrickxia sp. MSNUG]|uniref:GNAT family N-acetyltransferase n=1 Tax=Heyndrickxia sp. MSNUG TaxID=3136677 RepID=UPI003C2F2E51
MSITEQESVSLDFFKPEYTALLEDYDLHDSQKKYTAMPLEALIMCKMDRERHPVVIFYGNELAGFFVLHGREGAKEFSDNKDAILLRAYSVNATFQGKGIAKKSMSLLPSFVRKHFPTKNEIILAVNHANEIAQKVYLNGGFIDKGIRALGREGEMFILHLNLFAESKGIRISICE